MVDEGASVAVGIEVLVVAVAADTVAAVAVDMLAVGIVVEPDAVAVADTEAEPDTVAAVVNGGPVVEPSGILLQDQPCIASR